MTTSTVGEGAMPLPKLLTVRKTCALFGRIHPSTLYRGIRHGVYPAPIHVGGSSRWLRGECDAVLAQLISERSPRQ
jgi:predicted DNA-binding transcriptional regulator AlpA